MARSKQFRKTLLATGITAAISGTSTMAIAQSDRVMEEVFVRGIRSSLERSIDIKRESNQIVEAITAEDIGEMPDQNIAESLQRLTGVQIDRRNGQGTKVRIRGLDQNITLLNGESFSSGMEYFQLGEWKQEFDSSLESVPSELLGGVEVYKTPIASMVEGGIGGAINLKTRDSLDLKEPLIAVNIRGDIGSNSDDLQPQLFGVFGKNWDDTFGAIVSFSSTKQTVHTDYIQNFSRENTGIRTTNSADVNTAFSDEAAARGYAGVDELGQDLSFDEFLQITRDAGGAPYIVPGMFYVMDIETEQERTGGSVNLQWRPSDTLEFKFDWFHTDLELTSKQYTVKHPTGTDGVNGIDESQPYNFVHGGSVSVIDSAGYSVGGAETNTAGEVADSSADNFALRASYDGGGALRADFGVFGSTAEMTQRGGYQDTRFTPYAVTTYVGPGAPGADAEDGWEHTTPNTGNNTPPLTYSYRRGSQPGLSWSDPTWMTNSDNMLYKSAWALGSDVETDTYSVRADFEYDMDVADLKRINFGFRQAEEESDFRELRYLTDFSQTEGAMSPGRYNEDGTLAQASTFDPDQPPGSSNAGVQEAVYYDLCGNGGIPEGRECDIDGDGIDDNRPFGPWGYFHDAAIGLKAFDLTTSDGTNMATALYGPELANSGRFGGSPGYIPWRTFNDDPGASIRVGDFFPSGGYHGNVLIASADPIVADVSAWHDGLAPDAPSRIFEVPLESWNVTETTQAFYTSFDFEGQSVPYTLNVGLRAVKTEVETKSAETTPESSLWSLATDGWNSQGVLLVWDVTTKKKDYWDVLPSLNFVLDSSDDTKIRFSAAKVIARPNLQTLGKGFSKNFTRVFPGDYYEFTGGSAGNPNLEPFRATQADMSFEWYFDDASYASAGLFVKSVESFISSVTRSETQPDFSPSGESTGGVTRQVNGDGGSVQGVELAIQQSFDNGLGYAANYTFSDSDTGDTSMDHDDLGLPGVSEETVNLMGFFENEFLSTRLAYTYRSEYLSPYRSNFGLVNHVVGSVNTPPMAEFYDSYGQWDYNITWDITDNVSLVGEILNLTEQEQTSYLEYTNNPMTYTANERRFQLGVNVRL